MLFTSAVGNVNVMANDCIYIVSFMGYTIINDMFIIAKENICEKHVE